MENKPSHRWQCRTAPSIGALEDTPDNIWGTKPYLDEFQDTVFFGLYGFRDFFTLWSHKGRKCILWAGSDIQHFLLGYWLDEEGKMRIHPIQLSSWIDTNCESYVENEIEQEALRSVGIRSKVVPSFLGKMSDFPLQPVPKGPIKLYTSVSGDNFELYGWQHIPALAKSNPKIEFHLYGNTVEPPFTLAYKTNIHLHGRVPKEQMNEEVKSMTGALRLTQFDGFSEIIAKSLLWGQLPVSLIAYDHTLKPDDIWMLHSYTEQNTSGRAWLLSVMNKYPWNYHA